MLHYKDGLQSFSEARNEFKSDFVLNNQRFKNMEALFEVESQLPESEKEVGMYKIYIELVGSYMIVGNCASAVKTFLHDTSSLSYLNVVC